MAPFLPEPFKISWKILIKGKEFLPVELHFNWLIIPNLITLFSQEIISTTFAVSTCQMSTKKFEKKLKQGSIKSCFAWWITELIFHNLYLFIFHMYMTDLLLLNEIQIITTNTYSCFISFSNIFYLLMRERITSPISTMLMHSKPP